MMNAEKYESIIHQLAIEYNCTLQDIDLLVCKNVEQIIKILEANLSTKQLVWKTK